MFKLLGAFLASTVALSAPAIAIPALFVATLTIQQYNVENNNYPEVRNKWIQERIDLIKKESRYNAKQKAEMIFLLRINVVNNLNELIERGLMGYNMEIADKYTIVKAWAVEHDALQSLAFREYKPALRGQDKKKIEILEKLCSDAIQRRKAKYGF
jgi:hypothetical protein